MKRMMLVCGCLLCLCLFGCRRAEPTPLAPPVTPTILSEETLRVFFVNSYTADDIWALQIKTGIRESLDPAGFSFPKQTLLWDDFNMEAWRFFTEADLLAAADAVIAAIQAFGPDLVVVVGDAAARTVIPRYPDADLPFVFCGVKGDVADYGLLRSNVTGVQVGLRPVQTVAMAGAFFGGEIEGYMVLGDSSPLGEFLAAQTLTALAMHDPDAPEPMLRLVPDWEAWQEVVLDESEKVDFILLLEHNNFIGDDGEIIEESTLMAWMLENSAAPVFALSKQAVFNGAVGGLTAYGYGQGQVAGRLIAQVAQGARPDTIAVQAAHNRLIMNLAAARYWHLRIPVAVALVAEDSVSLPTLQGDRQ